MSQILNSGNNSLSADQTSALVAQPSLLDTARFGCVSLIEKANTTLGATVASVKETGRNMLDKATTASTKIAGATLEQSRALVRLANTLAGSTPDKENTLARELVKLAPIVGTYKTYADGWLTYHAGKEQNNTDLTEQGRLLCVTAWLAAGIDIGSLGLSFVVREINLGTKLLMGVKTLSKIGQFSDRTDIFQSTAKQLLKSDKVQKLADGFLDAVAPESQKA